ncbi:putative protein-disulfide isomerase [Parasphingorhabdus marina DSM 22363]|uniref:DSBA-like thioredoxin domain-containing protein n=1 Tax=Parasphingorhabdus marina DSM 22363 TaxID=1123272 RepID=A0A1N6D8T2_9SPHN|nr:hypothetical protein [Parasphingorhabdus marina]SIN67231.1 putative protein-disulfide isomerase [Parasphingorhabdus marina DSM 22363]
MSRRFTYIYDTFCGWCRGAHPTIAALIESGAEVEMLHLHLFQGAKAHRMADGFGTVALAHDKRVAGLSGQDFDQRYVDQVIQSPTEVLDSTFTAWAAGLVHDHGAATEIALAHNLQNQRYIDGVSAQNRSAVEAAIVRFGVSAALEEGAETAGQTAARARATLASLNLRGVPQLILEENGQRNALSIADFYKSPTAVTALAS